MHHTAEKAHLSIFKIHTETGVRGQTLGLIRAFNRPVPLDPWPNHVLFVLKSVVAFE